jgi:hypothetical protein
VTTRTYANRRTPPPAFNGRDSSDVHPAGGVPVRTAPEAVKLATSTSPTAVPVGLASVTDRVALAWVTDVDPP